MEVWKCTFGLKRYIRNINNENIFVKKSDDGFVKITEN